MGIFSTLFGKPVLQDEVFGQIELEMLGRMAPSVWYSAATIPFAPARSELFCCITADRDGPTDAQRAFFQHIESTYPALVEKLIPVIEEAFQVWQSGFTIADFAAEFKPVEITIPAITGQPVQWSWSFETIHEPDHLLAVSMSDGIPLPNVQFVE